MIVEPRKCFTADFLKKFIKYIIYFNREKYIIKKIYNRFGGLASFLHTTSNHLPRLKGVFMVRFWAIFSIVKMQFSQNYNYTRSYFCGHRRGAVECGAVWSLAKTITTPYLIFVVTCAVWCIWYGLNNLKSVYFSNFGFFMPNPKLIFFLYFGVSFKVLNSFFFILD